MSDRPPRLLRGGRAYGGAPLDLVIESGAITAAGQGLPVPHGSQVVDLDGRFLGPGLWDEHVHFTIHVTQRERLDVSGACAAADVAETVARAVASDPSDRSLLVGAGFRDALWTDAPSRAMLDSASPDRPVVVVSGDLHCGWLNSAAAREFGVELPEDGLLREADFFPVISSPQMKTPPAASAYRSATAAAAARGVVGMVEIEDADNPVEWVERVEAGVDSVRVVASVWARHLEAAIARGNRTGDVLSRDGLVTMGPLKIIADGSVNSRTAWLWEPYPAEHGRPVTHGVESVDHATLLRLMRAADAAGIACAVHAIGDRSLTSVLDAFEELGIGGQIEHAQLSREEDFARFGRLGLAAGIQPVHALDDRDVVDRVWPGRGARAFAYRSLLDGGARLLMGSDAPVAPLDPWKAIAAAVWRTDDDREAWHPEQRLTRTEALHASSRTRLAAGEPADLVIVEADPLTAERDTVAAMPVAATMLAGRLTHGGVDGWEAA